MGNIWIVDDEPSICWALKKSLVADGHAVEIFPAGEPFLRAIQNKALPKPHLAMLDVRLPGISGIELLRRMSNEYPSIPVIMMTAFGDLKVAVDAIQGKAFEYLAKPFSLDVALHGISRALQQVSLKKSPADPGIASQLQQDYLLGNSLLMQQVYKQIAVAANIDAPVLIEGEPGTGKSLVAAMVHRFSPRRGGPLLSYRVPDESKTQSEAEIFGIRFANSESVAQTGILQLASGGSLVIEEVGQLPIASQFKLLAAMESKAFTAESDSLPIELKARLLFTTTHSLESLVDDGDLLAALRLHLDVCQIRLPPLRERPEDIRSMAKGLLSQVSASQPLSITEQALQNLEGRQWLGNVRELRRAIQFGAVRAKGGVIQLEDLPSDSMQHGATPRSYDCVLREATKQWVIQRNAMRNADMRNESGAGEGFLYEDCLAIVEESLIEQMMQDLDGNRAAVAQQLGIHRSTLRQKMKRYDSQH